MPDPIHIPFDHDTIVCHPDEAEVFAQFAGVMRIELCRQIERGKAYTVKSRAFRFHNYPPTFVPEGLGQKLARYCLSLMIRRNPVHGTSCGWRPARKWLRDLLDPKYHHPKARRHA
jgi:hypothetical protein